MENSEEIQNNDVQMTNAEELNTQNERSTLFKYYSKDNIIKYGDIVIAYVTPQSMASFKLEKGGIYNNRCGSYKHDDIVGKKWGTKIATHTGRGFIYILHPTPELWTNVLPHRTQILYLPDISFISMNLNLKPGDNVIETGTGSGSFSHSIARSIFPTGHLYTFEFHEERSKRVRQEFIEHGLDDIITIQCRDASTGFGLKDCIDAVFLDLPAPWDAIPHTIECFKPNKIGKICCFSPCIEQVQRSCASLHKNKFINIRMFEVLTKPYEVRTFSYKPIPEVKVNTDEQNKMDIVEPSETTAVELEPSKVFNLTVSRSATTVRGHTSYLTFADYPKFNDLM